MSAASFLISVAIARNRGAHPEIGVVLLIHRLGVFLSTPAIRQKSDCFQWSTRHRADIQILHFLAKSTVHINGRDVPCGNGSSPTESDTLDASRAGIACGDERRTVAFRN